MTVAKRSFAERLDRINNPGNIAWKDPETGINVPRRLSRKAINEASSKIRKVTPLALCISIVLGMLCLMAGRFVRFHFAGITSSDYDPLPLLGMDIAAGFVVAVFAGAIIGHSRTKHQMAQVAGIALMSVTMHNLVWAFPEEARQVYGPAFVAEVMEETTPRSIYLSGRIIAL